MIATRVSGIRGILFDFNSYVVLIFRLSDFRVSVLDCLADRGHLVCSEIWVRALLCVIMYFDKKRTRCISFCRGVLSCIFGIRQYYYYKHVYPSCEFAGVRWLLSTNTLSSFDSTCWFPTMLFRLS